MLINKDYFTVPDEDIKAITPNSLLETGRLYMATRITVR